MGKGKRVRICLKKNITAKSYIQNGLIAMWDGIENSGWGVHDSSATVWKDLVGNRNFNLVEGFSHFEDNAFSSDIFNKTSGQYSATSNWQIGKNIVQTIEIVYHQRTAFTDYNESIIVNPSTSDYSIVIQRNNAISIWRSGSGRSGTFEKTAVSAVKGYTNGWLINGARGSANARWSPSMGNYTNLTKIGNRDSGDRAFDGLIYSLRFYNRALSEEEELYNYSIDKERFNLESSSQDSGTKIKNPPKKLFFAPRKPYDSEIEYLESTGTQYIDTGVYIDSDSAFYISAEVRGTGTTNIGLASAGNNPVARFEFYIWLSHMEGYVGSLANQVLDPDIAVGDMISISGAAGNVRYENLRSGVVVTAQYSPFGKTATTATLFALHRGRTEYTYRGKYRLYHATVGGLDLTPVRFTNENGQTEGALYDKVSKQLFRNSGTGSFLLGPDKKNLEFKKPKTIYIGSKKITAKDYIQDGLIAMWDGIENVGYGVHDSSSTTWKDLTGSGYDLAVLNGGSFNKRSFVLTRRARQASSSKNLEKYYTLEIALSTTITGASLVFIPISGNNQRIFAFYGFGQSGQWLVKSASPRYTAGGKNGVIGTYSVTYSGDNPSRYFVNGTATTSTEGTDTWSPRNTGGITLNDIGGYYFTGNIYFIRAYNRALTDSEISVNYAIDKARFNLP